MKIAIVGDIHHGDNNGETQGEAALPLLAKILADIERHEVDVLIDLGDRINDRSHADDLALTRAVGALFDAFPRQRAHVLGNHDTVNLSSADVARSLGKDAGSTVISIGDWDLVIWSFPVDVSANFTPRVPVVHLDWLDTHLNSRRRSLLFTHFPLDRQDPAGNWYFHNNPHMATFENLDAVHAILQKKDGLAAVFTGHTHWNSLSTRDDVHFVGIPSVSGTFCAGKPEAAWALAEVGTALRIDVFGARARAYILPVRTPGSRWASPRTAELKDRVRSGPAE